MEGIDQFEQSFIVGQYECDCNGRMKAGALLSQTQAISTNPVSYTHLTLPTIA